MSRRSANTTKVFVGSLPAGTTVNELRNLFAPYGDIAECDVVNRCGFLHLENKQLAFKAIDELNNSNFKGSKISVEKGRVKSPPGKSVGGRGQRNGYDGGAMRGGRDNFRGTPYGRDNFERRGPCGGGPMRHDNNYCGGGYDRDYDNRPPLILGNMMAMNDGYGSGPYMEERRFPDSGYRMEPGGDARIYPEDRGMYSDDRQLPLIDSRSPYDRRPLMDDRRALDARNCVNIMDRRPLMDAQVPPVMGLSPYDRRHQVDMYSRRDIPPKPMGGSFNETSLDSGYDSAYPSLQQHGYTGGPGLRRDLPPPRRY